MPDSILKNYFLGKLSADDAATIEHRILEDDDFATEISIAEESLVEEFLSGELSASEMSRFKTDYLLSEERIKNVELVALLHRYASENSKTTSETFESKPVEISGLSQWLNSLGSGFRLAAASLAVIAVVVTSLWFLFRPQVDDELTALQDRYERLNQDPDSHPHSKDLSEITLVSDTLRSASSIAIINRATLSEDIRFRIALPPQTDLVASYDVAILRDSKVVFRQNRIRPVPNSTIPELRLILPRDQFSAGSHRAVLIKRKTEEIIYHFIVE